MVDTGIVQKLLELLDRHVEEGNVTVQHAALSALRNLAIPGKSNIEGSMPSIHKRKRSERSKLTIFFEGQTLRHLKKPKVHVSSYTLHL